MAGSRAPLPRCPLPGSSSAAIPPSEPTGQPRATTHPPDPHGAEPGPGALGWKGPRSPPASPTPAPPAALPRRWAPRSSADACSAPGLSPHLVPSPPGLPALGFGDPLERGGSFSGCRMEAGARPLHCLVLRRGHTDLSSGKTPSSVCRHRPLRFGFNPW